MRRALTFGNLVLRDMLGVMPHSGERQEHLEAAAAWLVRAHDLSPDDGVSYGYSMRGGWRRSYLETSGYISETFFDLAESLGGANYKERADRIVSWLCEQQLKDGSIPSPHLGPGQGVVFDTGQVLFGFVRAYRATSNERYLDAAIRAGDWLAGVADGDGQWTQNTFNGIQHTYNSRVAWAVLELESVAPDSKRRAVALANLSFACDQEEGGWFKRCAFEAGVAPYTHTIAYAIRGLLEGGRLRADEKMTDCAMRAADAVLSHVRDDGYVPGRIDTQGKAASSFCCLTGNAQLAIIWYKLAKWSGQKRYAEAAGKALDFVVSYQDIRTRNVAVNGAVKGSQPIWGKYSPLTFPNWATKFLIDALLVERGQCIESNPVFDSAVGTS